MSIDRPANPAPPSPDRPPDHPRSETRHRQEYYAERTNPSAPANRIQQTWAETAEISRWMWTEYKRRWPPEDRPPPDTSRSLKPADSARVEAECDRIAEREREKISPALRAVESQTPDRHLIGLEHCRKGRDRIKEKVHGMIKELRFSPEEAVSHLPDAIRYTFQYDETRYTRSVSSDIERLQDQGFKLDRLKNSWADKLYKGINSQWIDQSTGQRFEVQFHTRISFEAKQITHSAYERLRTMKADKFEELVLEAFQTKVAGEVPIPPGAAEIPDYPKRGSDGR